MDKTQSQTKSLTSSRTISQCCRL